MNEKLKPVLQWGKFNAIAGIVISILSILSFNLVGIISLLGFLKLNNATDELKRVVASNPNPSSDDYENIMVMYGEYFKMLGISIIVMLALMALMIVLGIVFMSFILSLFGSSMMYY